MTKISDETLNKIEILAGMWTIVCLVMTYQFGWQAVVAWFLGLFFMAAILNAFSGDSD